MLKIRRSWYRRIFNMGAHILIRHLYIETALWLPISRCVSQLIHILRNIFHTSASMILMELDEVKVGIHKLPYLQLFDTIYKDGCLCFVLYHGRCQEISHYTCKSQFTMRSTRHAGSLMPLGISRVLHARDWRIWNPKCFAKYLNTNWNDEKSWLSMPHKPVEYNQGQTRHRYMFP